ncbi:MAG TPA: histidinol-phosphate transaminase [Methylomirabilota bacterium]|jgi:histidinol-phosphate aminotransferase|nr:histidinol-phosphate transaminase [Methylomirabilota bacterium]
MDISKLVPEWIRTLTPYQPGKPIEELEREYGVHDSIKIASNENPLGPSPKAVAAIAAALPHLHLYPDGDCFYLKKRLSEKLGIDRSRLIIGNGSNELIEMLVRTFMRVGEAIVVGAHAFAIYHLVAQAAGCRTIAVPHQGFKFDLEAMARAITPDTRIVFLDNPNNPTGTIYTRREWEVFLAAVPADVLIVVDEAYFEFVEDQEYPDSFQYHDGKRLLVTLRTFSKICGLAGVRVGYGVSSPEIIDALNRIRQPFNVNSLAQVGALAALDDEDHIRRTQENNRQGLAYLRKELDRLRLKYAPSWANFLLVQVGAGTYQRLLPEGVIIRPMEGYGFPGYARVSVGTPTENKRFITAMEKLLKT